MENITDNWKWIIVFCLYHFKSNSVSSYKKKAYAVNNFDKHMFILLEPDEICLVKYLFTEMANQWNQFTSQQILLENFRLLEWVPYIYYTQLNKFDMFVSLKLSPIHSEHIHHSTHLSEPCLLPPQPSMMHSTLIPEPYVLPPVIEEYILYICFIHDFTVLMTYDMCIWEIKHTNLTQE